MPTRYQSDPPHLTDKKFHAIRAQVEREMLAQGWTRLSRKFDNVMYRRARSLYRAS